MKANLKNFKTNKIPRRHAFTLIELLVVIAVIGVLAAFTLVVAGSVKQRAFKNRAQAELEVIKTAIERYKDAYGFYPPGNPNNVLVNQLYYELEGTRLTNDGATTFFVTLDGGAQIPTNDVATAFGIGGFLNCTKPGAEEDTRKAQNFLPDLKPNQIGTVQVDRVLITNLVTSVGGPLASYQPLAAFNDNANPWRYVCPGTNNPNSYDLWVQIVIKPGQTNLICNWNNQVQINSPLP